ncbi:putative RNA-directed DNA polymerase [Helianthus annuus]|nr:putative RNA-directed DNA polymerase [Helianthus annuus]
MSEAKIKKFWNGSPMEYVKMDAEGRSGGILSIWNPGLFKKNVEVLDKNFIMVKGDLIGVGVEITVINVYAPNVGMERRNLWDRLLSVTNNIQGMYLLIGDFNEVRVPEDRMNSIFDSNNAMYFNNFISTAGLLEYPMSGRKYTFLSGDGKKMSKIDRFLVSSEFMTKWPNATLRALERVISDHSPLILMTNESNYGPTPFRFFNSWLEIQGVDEVVRTGLEYQTEERFKDLILGSKLKAIKEEVKKWRKNTKEEEERVFVEAINQIKVLDAVVEERDLEEGEIELWRECKSKVREWVHRRAKDLQQKARVKWILDGDENSKYFHTIVNCKLARSRLHGLWINGVWVTDPQSIMKFIQENMGRKFAEPCESRPRMSPEGFAKISSTDANFLIAEFTREEVKKAVWDCGSDKAPGPDGITFALIKRFWSDIENIVMDMMGQFHIHGSIQKSCSASFISLIPKVDDPVTLSDFRPISLIGIINKIISKVLANRLKGVLNSVISKEQSAFVANRNIVDGPLILNEVVSWAKKQKKKIFLFKADIEKAYDTLSWKFLITILTHMGFPSRWKTWIMGILFSGKASVLVNGTPTGEFQYKRGLRQGDPLSPFLFTIAMEALHVLMVRAVSSGIIQGVKMPNNGLILSHLFFADDSIFMGEWDEGNLKNLRRVLRIFYMMSGLKVNHNKSFLYGIGSSEEVIGNMASVLNCKAGSIPFTYLGLRVGANMNRLVNWKEVLDKFNKRLSNWKAKLLSFAGRITLVKSVLGSLPNYYLSLYKAPKAILRKLEGIRRRFLWGGCGGINKMRWVKWERIVASKNMGGLGIGGIREMNMALLLKWRWRYKEEPNQMWVKVIEALHTNRRKIQSVPMKKTLTGVWKSIVGIEEEFMKEGIDVTSNISCKIGDGSKVMFWLDTWAAGRPLKYEFPLIYSISKDKKNKVRQNYKENNGGIIWDWKWIRLPSTAEERVEWDGLKSLLLQQDISQGNDTWSWKNNTAEGFSVKRVRKDIAGIIDINLDPNAFEWSKVATAKVNCFAWRAIDGKIPTLEALRRRGVQVGSVMCSACQAGTESADHVIIHCPVARCVWMHVWSWIRVPFREHGEGFSARLADKSDWPYNKTKAIYAIYLLTAWHLWRNRNNRIFSNKQTDPSRLVEEIREESFEWMRIKARRTRMTWNEWKLFRFSE